MPFQNQTRDSKSLKSPVNKEADKEPLLEHVKSKFMRAAIKKMKTGVKIAGFAGLSALMMRPATLTAQDVATNFSKGTGTEQTEKTILTCGASLDYINKNMQKLTDQNSIDMTNSIFGKVKPNKGKMDAKFVKGNIYDATLTSPAQKYFMDRLGINDNEFQKSVKNGSIEYDIAHMDEKGVDIEVHIAIIRGNKVIGTKSNQTEMSIAFSDKKDRNKGYTSMLVYPEGCEISEIIPFFGKVEGNNIQFGLYYKYTQNGIENEMVGYIFYDADKSSAIMSYIKKDNEKEVSYMGMQFKS